MTPNTLNTSANVAGELNHTGHTPLSNSLKVIQSLLDKIRAEAERFESARLIQAFEHDCNSFQNTIDNATLIVASGEKRHV